MKFKRLEQTTQVFKLSGYIKIGGIIMILLIVGEILVVNRLSIYGNDIKKLTDKKAKLELENLLLKEQIATLGSFNNMDKIASALGFEKIKNIEYIK